MKGLGKLLLLAIIIVIGAPIAGGAMALQPDATKPEYLEGFDYQSFNEEEEFNSIVQQLVFNAASGKTTLSLDEELVTKFIYQQMAGFESSEYRQTIQALNNLTVSLESMWVTFDDNVFTLYGLIGYNESKTTFTVDLEFEDFEGYTKVTLRGIKVGKLPIPRTALLSGVDYLEDKEYITAKDKELEFGELNTEELSLTIDDAYINEMLNDAMDRDIVIFKEIQFDNQEITLIYDFNPNNKEGQAIQATINEVNRFVTDETVRTDLETRLDTVLSDDSPEEKAVKDDINTVLDRIQEKIETGDHIPGDDDEALIIEMTEHVQQLEPEKQEAVAKEIVQTLITNMEEENQQAIEDFVGVSLDEALNDEASDNTFLNDLFLEFIGGSSTITE